MEYPKLKPRPMSLQICTNFAGLDRRPGASNRSRNKTWLMGWHDERNLSADRWPRLSVRHGRGAVEDIDGNDIQSLVAAMCGGDRMIVLEDTGLLWCGGHSFDMLDVHNDFLLAWTITSTVNAMTEGCSVAPNPKTLSGAAADVITTTFGRKSQTVTLYYEGDGQWTTRYIPRPEPMQFITYIDADAIDIADFGLTWVGPSPYIGDTITMEIRSSGSFSGNNTIIRMGAYALVNKEIWINAVKLAGGETLVAGEDYGFINAEVGVFYDGSPYSRTLTLCDVDGNPYSGVVVSSTEPAQTGYWLDTSGSEPQLMEWSVSQTTWVRITSTYVKIPGLWDALGTAQDVVRKGDAVEMHASFDEDNPPADGISELLNSSHYLYDAGGDFPSGNGWVLISGVLPSDSVTVSIMAIVLTRHMPRMDFMVEAQNRLWGCRYSEADGINEIYASKLGDFRNWSVFQGLSTDSWTASRGTAAPFTGAITLGGNPLFFREEWLEKVFPSASGAHQIATYSLEGVQKGSHNSMVVIDERLYYKSRLGVCVYAGTMPARISEEFGDWMFSSATAARHLRKYVVCMTRSDGERLCMVYDLETGDWHAEDEVWDGLAVTWEDVLYYVKNGVIIAMDGAGNADGVEWYAETDEMSVELPEHKWISCLRLRLLLEMSASCRIYISYDGGPWQRKAGISGNTMHSVETAIWPRRCDHFRLRLEGVGGCELQSVSYRVERSQGGH